MTFVSIFLPILFVIITLLLWRIYGKDNKVIEPISFYPPEEINSAELALLYNGKVYKDDVISLLPFLANRGYIKISKIEVETFLGLSQSYNLTKLKDYDGKDANERSFIASLFKGPKKTVNTTVNTNELPKPFYNTIVRIADNLNTKKKSKIFNKSASQKKLYVIGMIVITYILITFRPAIESTTLGTAGIKPLLIGIIIPGIMFPITYIITFCGRKSLIDRLKCSSLGLFGLIPWLLCVLPTLLVNLMYSIIYMIGFVCIVIMILLLNILPKRTLYGDEMLGKIKGFQKSIETLENSKFEELVTDNPNYFYEILPYTYVLGLSKKWINEFGKNITKMPDWCDIDSIYELESLNDVMYSSKEEETK